MLVDEGTVAVVGDVIVKIDAPDAEEMQFKGHGDDEDSKKEEKEQESPVQEEASSTQSQEKTEVDESKTVKGCRQCVSMHVKMVSILKL